MTGTAIDQREVRQTEHRRAWRTQLTSSPAQEVTTDIPPPEEVALDVAGAALEVVDEEEEASDHADEDSSSAEDSTCRDVRSSESASDELSLLRGCLESDSAP